MAQRQNLTYSRISCERYEEEEEEDCVDHFCSFVGSKNDCTPRYTSFFSQSSRGIMGNKRNPHEQSDLHFPRLQLTSLIHFSWKCP